MARLFLRLLGLCLLAVAITVPGCQALFSHDADVSQPLTPDLIRDGDGDPSAGSSPLPGPRS